MEEAKLGKAMYIEYYLPPDPPGKGTNSLEYNKLDAGFVGRRAGQDVRFDHDGNVWLTDRGYPHRLVKLDPRTGIVTEYQVPTPAPGSGILPGTHRIQVDKNDIVWASENWAHNLVRLDPATGDFTIIPIHTDTQHRHSPNTIIKATATRNDTGSVCTRKPMITAMTSSTVRATTYRTMSPRTAPTSGADRAIGMLRNLSNTPLVMSVLRAIPMPRTRRR